MRDAGESNLKLENFLCFAIYSTANALTRAYQPRLAALNLTYPQYLVMVVLWEQKNQAVKSIGEKLGLDSGTLTPLLKRLEIAGLITRTRDRSDERQVLIGLTDAGEAMREKAESVPLAMGKAFGCSMGEAKTLRAELMELRQKLIASIDDAK
ncbi:MarR family transcriptional regulator [Phyllobacterium sp. 21LDTY02-6]|jgi:MarR family transcriptional regulator, organic hydroperoxide resistance regulator|uniref:MarR family winged helix-turn-helix transcriptional regulator n=1 Tax=unclassified Phyllobacterium TaxID=2638441 RepID=UPI002021E440|nr:MULTISPECIES: MarR family transcriptional regulator [unclassified Phyllobacterium]MCO4317346.1 MarR family transcriptional regulator [Phyllobacterium sp. 21LDTY02-6]MCX8293275.1 MarR family transcriptional regulator [Phyllobacterium sp. 0TCS1.6A]